MSMDDLVREAGAEAAASPPLSADERAPFEHLRDEFIALMRASREAPQSHYAEGAQLVVALGRAVLELLDRSLQMAPMPMLWAARGSADDGGAVCAVVCWPPVAGVEVRLWRYQTEDATGTRTIFLGVDAQRDGWQLRPFGAALEAESGDAVTPEVICTGVETFAGLRLPGPGMFRLRLRVGEEIYTLHIRIVA